MRSHWKEAGSFHPLIEDEQQDLTLGTGVTLELLVRATRIEGRGSGLGLVALTEHPRSVPNTHTVAQTPQLQFRGVRHPLPTFESTRLGYAYMQTTHSQT